FEHSNSPASERNVLWREEFRKCRPDRHREFRNRLTVIIDDAQCPIRQVSRNPRPRCGKVPPWSRVHEPHQSYAALLRYSLAADAIKRVHFIADIVVAATLLVEFV